MICPEDGGYTVERVDEGGATGGVSSFPPSGGPPHRFPPDWDFVAEGFLGATDMPDGRKWGLIPLTFGRNRIVIVEDQFTMGEHWCYSDPYVGMANWALGPEHTPVGWSRHSYWNEHGEWTQEWPS